MAVLQVDRVLLGSPGVGPLCDGSLLLLLLPVYHLVLLLPGEGGGVVEGQLGDLDVCLLSHWCGLPVLSDLQVGGEGKVGAPDSGLSSLLSSIIGVRKVLRAGGGWSRLRPYEGSVRVLRPYEVMRGLGGDVLDRTGDIPLHTQSPVRQGGVEEGGRVVESDD